MTSTKQEPDTKVLTAALIAYSPALIATGIPSGPWWLAANLTVLIGGSMTAAWAWLRGSRIPLAFQPWFVSTVGLTGLFVGVAILRLQAG